MTAKEVGFDGEVNIFTPTCFSVLAHQRLSIRVEFVEEATK
jgi:hypothetical protein